MPRRRLVPLGVAGMDSSRSGLLSTLLMTLPLIIVPAMALLRPPNPSASVSSQNLAADDSPESPESALSADELGFPDDFSGKPAADTPSDTSDDVDINAIFGDQTEKPSATPTEPQSGSDPFQTSDSAVTKSPAPKVKPRSPTAPAPRSSPSENIPPDTASSDPDHSSAQRLVQQLNALGSIRTFWFDAGDRTPVGFAAFFRGQTELTVYRFEAVGQTRAECAKNVLDQVTAWRRQAATSP
jgi:hypothetical protein